MHGSLGLSALAVEVRVMAVKYRGLYLVGNKLNRRIRAVHVVDSAGKSATLRLRDYVSCGIEPEYKTLPWQEDVVFRSADPKSESS
jgi:hypothetical protein